MIQHRLRSALRFAKSSNRSILSLSLSSKSFSTTKRINDGISSPTTSTTDDAEYEQQRQILTKNLMRYAYSISSYFRLPEQGVENYELLSRGSVFFVKASYGENATAATNDYAKTDDVDDDDDDFNFDAQIAKQRQRRQSSQQQLYSHASLPRFHLISTAHITHPFYFERLYPEDQYPWLRFISERDTMTKLQLRHESTGEVLYEFELDNRRMYRHPTRDLIVMHLRDEQEFIDTMQNHYSDAESGDLPIRTLDLDPAPPAASLRALQDVAIVGHDLVRRENVPPEMLNVPSFNPEEVEVLVPSVVPGQINLIAGDSGSVFARTRQPLVMGMCGGPVLRLLLNDATCAADNGAGAGAGADDADAAVQCVGIIEGLVAFKKGGSNDPDSLTPFQRMVQDNALFIASSEIHAFVREVESKMLQGMLSDDEGKGLTTNGMEWNGWADNDDEQ